MLHALRSVSSRRRLAAASLFGALAAGTTMVSAAAAGGSSVTATATASPAAVARGGKGTVTVTLAIKPGWHVYAADPGSPNYIPTTVTATAPAGITVGKAQFPKPASLKSPVDPKPLNVYENRAAITVPFTVARTAKPGKQTLAVKVGYQTCNASMCLPPATASLTAAVTVK